jgi:hypothetical protein
LMRHQVTRLATGAWLAWRVITSLRALFRR